jgi:hypothetical protein
MAWRVYRTEFHPRTPTHVGFLALGFIQRTRLYIPGRTLWGAVTARLCRALYDQPDTGAYRLVGTVVKEALRFTYIYPFWEGKTFIPRYGEGGLLYGPETGFVTASEFEGVLVGGYGSTAINPFLSAAEEGSLHEIETLLPRTRSGARVAFVGYLLACERRAEDIEVRPSDEGISVSNGMRTVDLGPDVLEIIQVGGERCYGYGRAPGEVRLSQNPLWDCYPVDGSKREPLLTISKGQPVPAHLNIGVVDFKGAGDLEPLVGREWDNPEDARTAGRGAGRRLRTYGAGRGVYWTPGSVHQGPEPVQVRVGYYGLLEGVQEEVV